MQTIRTFPRCKELFQPTVLWLWALTIVLLYDLTPTVESFDTPFYLLAGEHIINGRIDCLRTPVYPLLLKLLELALGYQGMKIAITIIQSVVYLISIQALDRVLRRVVINKKIQVGTLLFYATTLAPALCNELTTESLSLSGCIILTDIIMQCTTQTKWWKHVLSGVLILVLVFLRPTFILFFAILPAFWIVRALKEGNTCHSILPIVITICCIGAYWGYTKVYESQYGKQTTTISFECNTLYNLKRSGCWDLDAVISPESKALCSVLDNYYVCNYEPLYHMIDTIPNALPLLSEGFADMVSAHKRDYYQFRVTNFLDSFNSRFIGGINTHSILGSILFVGMQFLAIPLSLFYLIVPLSMLVCLLHTIRRRKIYLFQLLIVSIVFAQYIGIVFSASEAHARLMTPVYGLFLVIIAMGVDLVTHKLIKE